VAGETSLSAESVEENTRKMESYFVGVDVGTGSVRAALVTRSGKLLRMSSEETKTWNPNVGYFEQSTDDIWKAVSRVVKVKQFVSASLRIIVAMQIRKYFSLFTSVGYADPNMNFTRVCAYKLTVISNAD
jgi:hypothetical protein